VADEKVSVTAIHVGDDPCMERSIEGGDEARLGHLAVFY
jgi:hypothetical protein